MPVLFAFLISIMLSILCALLFAILCTILFAFTIRRLFLNIGPFMAQKTHSSRITHSISSRSHSLERFWEKARILARNGNDAIIVVNKLPSLSRALLPMLARISPHSLLNRIPKVQILQLQSREHFPFSCTSKSCRETCTYIVTQYRNHES